MKEGGANKKKKSNNQNSNKTSSVNQEQSRFQTRKGKESSRFNEGRHWRRAKLASTFSVALWPRNPMRISTPSLRQQEIIRRFAKESPLSCTLIVLQTEEAASQGWSSRVLDCGSQKMGWFHQGSRWDGECSGQRDLLQTKACLAPSKRTSLYFAF